MTTRTRRTLAAVAVIAGLSLATACGGEDETSSDRPAATTSSKAPATPAGPVITLSKGTPCGPDGDGSCALNCTDPSCARVKVVATGLDGKATCRLESNAPGAPFPARTVGNGSSEPGWFMGYPGKTLTATCGGVTSNTLTWS